MRVALIAVMLVLAASVWSASQVEARPGAGPTFLEPSASVDAKGRGKRPPKPSIGRPGGAAASERSNGWSYRPGYAAPWSEPPEKTTTSARGTAASQGAGQGSFTAFYFWIVVGVALVVLAFAGVRMMRQRDDDAWTSGTASGWTPAKPQDREPAPDP